MTQQSEVLITLNAELEEWHSIVRRLRNGSLNLGTDAIRELGQALRKFRLEIEEILVNGKVFSITLKGSHTTGQLILKARYGFFFNLITDENFPLQFHDPVDREIAYVKFDHEATLEEVLAEFERRGLERPTVEDALYFGIQYPEEQREHFITFLHEPLPGPIGNRGVLILTQRGGERSLRLDWCDDKWPQYCVFAGVRKVA